jgi:hypothetical protein
MVAADAFVDLLQDVIAFFSENALHEYSRSSAPPVELVPDYYIGLGPADNLLGQVLVGANLLLTDVVDEGLPPVHVYHHDLVASLRRHWVSGRGCRLRDGWRMKLVDEDSAGTCVRVEPSFDKTSAATLLSRATWWNSRL